MKLITIFNYPDEENYNLLCKLWLQQAKNHAGDLDIEVWYHKNKPNLDIGDVKLVQKDTFGLSHSIPSNLIDDKSRHNVGFKLYNLCRETEPFIFIDADAIVFHDLDRLVHHSQTKPMIMVDHQRIPSHTDHIPFKFLNSGVQVCSDPSILIWKDIVARLNVSKKFVCPGTDQAMLFDYFKSINYKYTHTRVGSEWNSCAGYTDYNLNKYIFGDKYRLNCKGLDREHRVFINHYWYNFKPWDIGCPVFADFKKKEAK